MFLARWNNNFRSYLIRSVSDLKIITDSLGIVRSGIQLMTSLVQHPQNSQTSSSNEYVTNHNKN